MAVTPVGNPYVESSDLVANYPGASEALAERIDIVGVNPFADSAARATAIPSPVEGMMSSLNDTDAVERYDGATWKPVGGKVLQVVSTAKTDAGTLSVAAFSFSGNVSGLTATITPSAASSKILVSGVMNLARDTTAPYGQFRIMRDSTGVGVGDTAGSRARLTSSSLINASSSATIIAVPFSFLDSPETTSAVVYAIQLYNVGGSTFVYYINRNPGDSDSALNFRTISTITVMEISA